MIGDWAQIRMTTTTNIAKKNEDVRHWEKPIVHVGVKNFNLKANNKQR
jgi:hypothetical protein